MTKKLIPSYIAFLCIAVLMAGATSVLASEVTGTLSSDTASDSQTSGNIGGTVSDDSQTSGDIGGTVVSSDDSERSGRSSSSGGSRSDRSSNGGSSNTPSGSVLGETTSNTPTPSFPNAGFAPSEGKTPMTIWSTLVVLLKDIVSF